MINLNKSFEFFDPSMVTEAVHVIGVGALGSHIALILARLGVTNIHLYDFDIVEPVNVANQIFTAKDIGKTKLDAVAEHMRAINPGITLTVHAEGWTYAHNVSGHVFMATDNIEVRKMFIQKERMLPNVKSYFDVRMRLTDAQHYAADWSNQKHIENIWKASDFTKEEAKDATPISACGTTLSLITTVQLVSLVAVSNFLNFIKEGIIRRTILVDAFSFTIDAFE